MADSGNINSHTHRVMREMGVLASSRLQLQMCRKLVEDDMKDALFVQQLRTEENRLEMLPVLRMGVQGPLYQDKSNNV